MCEELLYSYSAELDKTTGTRIRELNDGRLEGENMEMEFRELKDRATKKYDRIYSILH